ncbi:MAG: diguanylate cyclase [Candidatus Schekmanbacteria bacterium]|nr:diguanylate cyclase [Candidatus Schekmanbacteria bacterium]
MRAFVVPLKAGIGRIARLTHSRSVHRKLILRLALLFALLLAAIQVATIASIRKSALSFSQMRAFSVAAVVKDSLTTFMQTGVINQRDIFLEKLKHTRGLAAVRVVRGYPVIRQFGPPRANEAAVSDIERAVLQTGKMQDLLEESLDRVTYSLIIPYVPSASDAVNCFSCHKAEPGEALGAVHVTMDLTETRRNGIILMMALMMMFLSFFLAASWIIVTFLRPYTTLYKRLRHNFERMKSGDFTSDIEFKYDDEAGDVARYYVDMASQLNNTFSSIRQKILHIMGYTLEPSDNAISDTVKVVNHLVDVYNLKRVIENDISVFDIFRRIEDMIIKEHKVAKYVIYQIEPDSGTMDIVVNGALPRCKGIVHEHHSSGSERDQDASGWCHSAVRADAQSCRAVRTRSLVDSRSFSRICPHFVCPMDPHCHKGLGYFCVPIIIGGTVGAVVQVAYGEDDRAQVLQGFPFITRTISEIASAIEAKTYLAIVNRKAEEDPLTKLFNRRFLDDVAPKLLAQAVRRDTAIGVLMIDIDEFKQVNDSYGHDVGDRVLGSIAALVLRSIRDSDYAVRYGGEEIVVLLMDAEAGGAAVVAETMRARIEAEIIDLSAGPLRKTVSIGVAELPADGRTVDECIKAADVAMYCAKRRGRNRVVTSGEAAAANGHGERQVLPSIGAGASPAVPGDRESVY